jgi:hypothetical protein
MESDDMGVHWQVINYFECHFSTPETGRLVDMLNNYHPFDEACVCLTGCKTWDSFPFGEALLMRVAHVDIRRRPVNMMPADDAGGLQSQLESRPNLICHFQ